MKTSSLYRKIEQLQSDVPWGHVLDAGTGPASLAWLCSLPTERWTAVTAQPEIAARARQRLAGSFRTVDRIIVDNWSKPELLAGEQFDTVLCDYFIGAVEAFAPYAQESLLQRMANAVRGRLYVTGLEPYVPLVAKDEVGLFVGDLARLRDACQLLARDRPYREYPAAWVAEVLRRSGLQPLEGQFFPIRYGQKFLQSQLEICTSRVSRFNDPTLVSAMNDHIARMRERGLALIDKHDGLPYGQNYVLAASRH